jgi:hypothetical protein
MNVLNFAMDLLFSVPEWVWPTVVTIVLWLVDRSSDEK